MVVRIHFVDREPVEYKDVNELEFTAAGGVVLKDQPTALATNPQNLAQQIRVPAGPPRLLGAWSAHARWTHVEEIDDQTIAAGVPPALEVAR